jgi:hypothetical protein
VVLLLSAELVNLAQYVALPEACRSGRSSGTLSALGLSQIEKEYTHTASLHS